MKTSANYFLDNKVYVEQPKVGYRSGIDAVLLAMSVGENQENKTVLDMGCGIGAVSLCIALNNRKSKIIAMDIQESLINMFKKNKEDNNLDNISMQNVDMFASEFFQNNPDFYNSCDIIVSNPPFFPDDKSIKSPNTIKGIAHNEGKNNLKQWIKFAHISLKNKGYFHLIHHAARIDEILEHMQNRFGEVSIIPIYSKLSKNAIRVLIRAKKNVKTPSKILPPLVLQDETGTYTSRTDKILKGEEFIVF